MYNDIGYNEAGYNEDQSNSTSLTSAIRYVAFPKRVASANREMHVRISSGLNNIFPNQQRPVAPPVIIYPPQVEGNSLGLLLILTLGSGGVLPTPPPPAVQATGNPLGLLLALTINLDAPGILPPPPPPPDLTGQSFGMLLALTVAGTGISALTTAVTLENGNILTTEDGSPIVYS
jgi:hypothetical protein